MIIIRKYTNKQEDRQYPLKPFLKCKRDVWFGCFSIFLWVCPETAQMFSLNIMQLFSWMWSFVRVVCPCVCRIRLSEGFHFAASGEGIVNMVIELPMRVKEYQHFRFLLDLSVLLVVIAVRKDAAFVFSGNVGRGWRQRESFLHRSVYPVSTSFCFYEGQVRRLALLWAPMLCTEKCPEESYLKEVLFFHWTKAFPLMMTMTLRWRL